MYVLAILMLCAVSLVPVHASAAPTITTVQAYTDNRTPDDPFGIPGYRVALSAVVADPGGVPANIRSVTARNLTTNETVTLAFAAMEAAVNANLYLVFLPFQQNRTGIWRFTVTNNQNQSASLDSHNLDKIVQLPFPTHLAIENFPGSEGNPPRISFESVPGAQQYQFELYTSDLTALYGAPLSSVPRFSIPQGLVFPGQEYVFRVRALQFDNQEVVLAGQSRLENRSVNALRADPGDFVPRPRFPIILIHGLCSDASTWATTNFAFRLRGWRYGGRLTFDGDDLDAQESFNRTAEADFYEVEFSDRAILNGILGWNSEFVRYLARIRAFRSSRGLAPTRFALVGHSAGGILARTVARFPDINDIITYGSPHLGAGPAAWLGALPPVPPISLAQCIAAFQFGRGVDDLSPGSPLLTQLNSGPVPPITFTSIIGKGCVSGDCVVSAESQDIKNVTPYSFYPGAAALPPTNRTHIGETSDFANIELAIKRGQVDQLFVTVRSPVSLVVTDPVGRSISKTASGIPLAVYEEVEDTPGHTIGIVKINGALQGRYQIQVIPNAEATLTDTFSLSAEVNGTVISLVEGMTVSEVAGLPPLEVGVRALQLVSIVIKPEKKDENLLELGEKELVSVAVLSSAAFDATTIDASRVTFGRTGYERSVKSCRAKDVDKDGQGDLMCRVHVDLTDLGVDDISAVLRGVTDDGRRVVGEQGVTVVCDKKKCR